MLDELLRVVDRRRIPYWSSGTNGLSNSAADKQLDAHELRLRLDIESESSVPRLARTANSSNSVWPVFFLHKLKRSICAVAQSPNKSMWPRAAPRQPALQKSRSISCGFTAHLATWRARCDGQCRRSQIISLSTVAVLAQREPKRTHPHIAGCCARRPMSSSQKSSGRPSATVLGASNIEPLQMVSNPPTSSIDTTFATTVAPMFWPPALSSHLPQQPAHASSWFLEGSQPPQSDYHDAIWNWCPHQHLDHVEAQTEISKRIEQKFGETKSRVTPTRTACTHHALIGGSAQTSSRPGPKDNPAS